VFPVRRISAALGTIALLASLAACGDKSDSGDTSGLGAVTVSGDFGKAPTVVWNGQATTDTLASTTLIEGDGETIASGDTVKVDLWIGNGFSQAQAYSSWKNGKSETIKLTDQVSKGILDAIVGHTVGSRVLVVAPPADAFGDQGQASLAIGNSDDVLFVVDIDAKIVVLDGPQGTPQSAPAGTPTLVEKDGTPTGFDFTGLPATAPKKFAKAVVIKGDGDVVKKGQAITVNYLGTLWGGKAPFDQSYTASPYSKEIGVGNFIKGWDNGLVGLTVGSRVILTIPPGLAYGAKGSGDTIPPNSTLVFVVDILSAS
jgi:peptidylprolyl isomerase